MDAERSTRRRGKADARRRNAGAINQSRVNDNDHSAIARLTHIPALEIRASAQLRNVITRGAVIVSNPSAKHSISI